jgi:hypothetical protein
MAYVLRRYHILIIFPNNKKNGVGGPHGLPRGSPINRHNQQVGPTSAGMEKMDAWHAESAGESVVAWKVDPLDEFHVAQSRPATWHLLDASMDKSWRVNRPRFNPRSLSYESNIFTIVPNFSSYNIILPFLFKL